MSKLQPVIIKIEHLKDLRQCIENDTKILEALAEQGNNKYDADYLGDGLESNKKLIECIDKYIVECTNSNSEQLVEILLGANEFNRLESILECEYEV